MKAPAPPRKEIIIIGGGIIGSTTSFFLTRHPTYNPTLHKITVLEASSIAGGASGKAGGLVALWAYPDAIVPLSWALHAQLAAEFGGEGRWGYRKVEVGSLVAHVGRKKGDGGGGDGGDGGGGGNGEGVSLEKRKKEEVVVAAAAERTGSAKAKAGVPADLDWVDGDVVRRYSVMSEPGTTAQVHPYQFTKAMAELAEEKGVKIVIGTAVRINQEDNKVTSVTYKSSDASEEEKTIPATDVVIAAGPWTRNLWPEAPISALRAHSVTIRPSRPISAYAIFTDIKLANGKKVSPEIYARPNNEAYACGEGDTLVELPDTSAEVETDPKRCQDIIDHVGAISEELRNGEVLVRQACYLPNVEGAVSGPLIGPTGVTGVYMAAGHTCWGISNGPATGKLMSEFIFDGKAKSAKIESLDPRQVL